MNPTDTSYQQDILQVKQIWNDIQNVSSPKHKQLHSAKTNKKSQNTTKNTLASKYNKKQKSISHSKSQINIAHSAQDNQQAVITFSTQKPGPTSAQKDQNKPLESAPFTHSKYVDNFNYRSALEQKDTELALLRVTNQRLKDQIDRLQQKITEKDHLIAKYKLRQNELLGQTHKFSSEKIQTITRNVEYANYKNDSRRLLKMLESTEEYKYFAKLALDDDGARRLTMTGKKSKLQVNEGVGKQKTEKRIHFCSCNQEFIPQDNFWVPEKAYDFGREYVKSHKGEGLSEAELELLMYELNRIWREREKRIINWLKYERAFEVGKYKRKVEKMRRDGEVKQE